MTLLAEAERAEDIADAFSKFRGPVAHDAAEIASIIAELNGISRALRCMYDLINSEFEPNLPLVQDDLNLVLESISFTFDDIRELIGRIGGGAPTLIPTDYRVTWKQIHHFFAQHGRIKLTVRLEMYHLFTTELCSIMRRRPVSRRQVESLRVHIRGLLTDHNRALLPPTVELDRLAIAPTEKRSYERERLPSSPTSSRTSNPPWLPEAPLSPTTTHSSTTHSSVAAMASTHWASRVFTDLSMTELPESEEPAGCPGGESMPDARERLREEGFEELLKIAFGRRFQIRLYHRQSDYRARMLCETPTSSGGKWYSCLSLHKLILRRKGATIFLCQRPAESRDVVAWAILPFTTMERLVNFSNTFLSLRSHDGAKLTKDILDHELAGEKRLFSGLILDDGYRHCLRLYQDECSGAIRLQASVLDGPLHNTPVWTAFITHLVASPTWLQDRLGEGRKTIYLAELRRHIFSPRYTARLSSNGYQKIQFDIIEDTETFVYIIRKLARRACRARDAI